MNPTLAFVGVGRMGANMARRLHDCGRPLTAMHDLHRPTAEARAARAGARTLEACMASSIPQARDGLLYLICGGGLIALAPEVVLGGPPCPG